MGLSGSPDCWAWTLKTRDTLEENSRGWRRKVGLCHQNVPCGGTDEAVRVLSPGPALSSADGGTTSDPLRKRKAEAVFLRSLPPPTPYSLVLILLSLSSQPEVLFQPCGGKLVVIWRKGDRVCSSPAPWTTPSAAVTVRLRQVPWCDPLPWGSQVPLTALFL